MSGVTVALLIIIILLLVYIKITDVVMTQFLVHLYKSSPKDRKKMLKVIMDSV